MCACNHNTGEVDVGGSEFPDHPQLHSELEASLGYKRTPSHQKQKTKLNCGAFSFVIAWGMVTQHTSH